MRSMSQMSSDSEYEGTEFERKLSTRASRRLSAKRRGSSVLERPKSAKAKVRNTQHMYKWSSLPYLSGYSAVLHCASLLG